MSESVANKGAGESFQSPHCRCSPTEVTDSARDAASNAGDVPTTTTPPTIPDVTETAINPTSFKTDTKNVEKSLKTRSKRSRYISKGLYEPSSTLPQSWRAKLERGLRRHKECQTHAVAPKILEQYEDAEFDVIDVKNSPLDHGRDHMDEEVVKGIATLWTALQNQGKIFAFGSSVTFLGYRVDDWHDVKDPAVKGPKYPFIMSLSFLPADNLDGYPTQSPEPKDRRKPRPLLTIGHHLLAVARVTDGPIIVTVLDTIPGFVKREKIESDSTSVITRSGWLGKDKDGDPLPAWPTVEFEYPTVPKQEGVNTCGLYVILNAWATMLEVEITPHLTRRQLPKEETPKVPFVTALLELINLAIAGHLDTDTILAFMVAYGYILEPRYPNSIPNVNLDKVYNQTMVAQALYESRQREKVELGKPLQKIVEDDVVYVINRTGCTYDWAKMAVENARGIRNVAPFFVPPEQRNEHLRSL